MKYIFSLLFIFISFILFSQSDTLSHRKDTIKLKTEITLAGYWNKTNNNNILLSNINTLNTLYNKKNILYFSLNYVYGIQNDKILTNNDLTLNTNLNLRRDKKIYYWYSFQYDNSFSLNIKNRIQSGGGIGYYLIRNKKLNINLSNGFLYEYYTIENVRNSTRLKITLDVNYLKFESSNYYQKSILFNNDYIFKSSNNINIFLKPWASLKLNLTNNYVSITEKKNLLYTIGINFTF